MLLTCTGKDLLLDGDYSSASPEAGVAYLAMLSVDSLLGVVAALESLADTALANVEEDGAGVNARIASQAACVALVQVGLSCPHVHMHA